MNDSVTNILFITSTRIGDAVLSTGLIHHCLNQYKNPRFTVVCGPLPAPLFEGVPGLEEIIPLKKESYNRHWLKLLWRVRGQKWDVVIDLRNSLATRFLVAGKKYYGGKGGKKTHKVLVNSAAMKLPSVAAPKLFLTEAQLNSGRELIAAGSPVLGVGPTANWIGKTWEIEKFIELVKKLTAQGAPFYGWRVAVFSAPNEVEAAMPLFNSLPDTARIDCMGKGNPGEAAGALARCSYYIGNDSGLMHCAAALGVKTMGLFGPSYPEIYAPWGAHTAFARTPESFDELIDFAGYDPKTLQKTLMASLSVGVVEAAVHQHLQKLMVNEIAAE